MISLTVLFLFSDALFHRDTKASIIYVLLYNNLSTESKDPKDILWAGGVAGKKFTKPPAKIIF